MNSVDLDRKCNPQASFSFVLPPHTFADDVLTNEESSTEFSDSTANTDDVGIC